MTLFRKRSPIFIFIFIAVLLFPIISEAGEKYQQIPAVIHAHTTISGGDLTPDELVALAKKSGMKILFITDTQRRKIEYGIWPLRNIIRKTETRQSVEDYGVENYFSKITRLKIENPDMTIIPGMEIAPFYYVDTAADSLTFRDYSRHMLAFGFKNTEDYAALPTIHGPASTRFLLPHLPVFLAMILLFAGAVYAAFKFKRKRYRIPAIIFTAVFALGIYNDLPFENTRFDQYSGYAGAAPYQDVIDAANEMGGFVTWAHPEAYEPAARRIIGPATFVTAPYPNMIRETDGYAAFAGLYGDRISFTKPGGIWDAAISNYCIGLRKRPSFIIAERDYSTKGERMDSFRTVFLVHEQSEGAVFDALRAGRMYALRAPDRGTATFDFEARDASGKTALMGETLISDTAKIRIHIDFSLRVKYKMQIIRDGAVIADIPGKGAAIDYECDVSSVKGKMSYIRVTLESPEFAILSNPIFFKSK